ncbi:MAG: 1-deoxy-D-xylulose-5-phosphate reductoisomerase, partial [Deltaproteobacteria bacterium]|nr:1-deoxy-D-xylulose-5-phosphate reductoisomerase [Deltaproteobacteria bacterium]
MKPGGKHITILGCTGSIGVKALDIVRRFPERFQILTLAAGKNIDLLAAQIAEFAPRLAVVMNEELAVQLKRNLSPDLDVKILFGPDGYAEAASLPEVDTVVSAMVGGAGLEPTWAAVTAGKRVALANKETLVMAGELIMSEALRRKAEIIPVDSEHSAIFQALEGQNRDEIKRIILTASGGPFFGKTMEEMAHVGRTEALSHPRWKMGAKISIDSATLMNKGLEVIEARWLFDCPVDKITIRIHPQSIIHSMVEFVDGSILAQMGVPDMRVPIAYAMTYPERLPLGLPGLDLPNSPHLSFAEPNLSAFPCLTLALEAGHQGGTSPIVL